MASFVGSNTAAVGAVDILTVNPHKAIDEFYSYSGDVAHGFYLVPHTIETNEKYSERRKFSCCVNYLAPTIDAIIRPIYDKHITRTTNNEMLKAFWENEDARGATADQFMRRSGEEVCKHSTHFIIMDNFPEDEQPQTEEEAIKNRIFPYVYNKNPQDVRGFVLNSRGGVESITFANGTKTIDKKEVELLLRIDSAFFTTLYVATAQNGDKSEVIISEVPHPLKRLPIKIMRSALPADGELCAYPKMYGLLRVCAALFNKDSEMRELERKQMFSLLAISNKDGGIPADISVGSSNTMFYNADTAPQYIEPNPNILLGLLETSKDLRDSFFLVAGQSGVTGIQTAKSGVAMNFEFMGKQSVILEYSEIGEDAEKWKADTFLDWTNATDREYAIEYPDNFTPADDANQYKWADLVLLNRDSLPASIVDDATLMIAMKLRPSMSDDDQDDLREEIRSEMDGAKKTADDLNTEDDLAE